LVKVKEELRRANRKIDQLVEQNNRFQSAENKIKKANNKMSEQLEKKDKMIDELKMKLEKCHCDEQKHSNWLQNDFNIVVIFSNLILSLKYVQGLKMFNLLVLILLHLFCFKYFVKINYVQVVFVTLVFPLLGGGML